MNKVHQHTVVKRQVECLMVKKLMATGSVHVEKIVNITTIV